MKLYTNHKITSKECQECHMRMIRMMKKDAYAVVHARLPASHATFRRTHPSNNFISGNFLESCMKC